VEEDIRALSLELVLTGVAAISGVIAAIVSAKQLRLAQARHCHGRRSDNLPTSRALKLLGYFADVEVHDNNGDENDPSGVYAVSYGGRDLDLPPGTDHDLLVAVIEVPASSQ
jgi:hypothetical protein